MIEIEDIFFNQTTKYTSKWSQYFELYERYFAKFVNQKPTVVEVGVDNGGSLEAWVKYFGEGSNIIGIDNRPKLTELPGARIVYGDQGDADFWHRFLSETPKIDIFVDDGSHFMNHQIDTWFHVFNHMNEGGIYFVEDTHSSYMDIFGGKKGKKDTFIEFAKEIVDSLHVDHMPDNDKFKAWEWPLYRSIKTIHFYDSVVVMEKCAPRPKYHVTYSHRSNYIS